MKLIFISILMFSTHVFAEMNCVSFDVNIDEMAGGVNITTDSIRDLISGDLSDRLQKIPGDVQKFRVYKKSTDTFLGCPEKVYWKNGKHEFGGIAYLLDASAEEKTCMYRLNYYTNQKNYYLGCAL